MLLCDVGVHLLGPKWYFSPLPNLQRSIDPSANPDAFDIVRFCWVRVVEDRSFLPD